ncbi:MAG: ATP-binding cassette domain-containing protein [Planctomycetales bacterium]|nr:ATP-binding cassette domain-containing protein [Planctomycetales bacterium]
MVEAHELTKAYPDLQTGQFVALDRVSFDVNAGEIFGLLGPNGAGKTTALRILSTVLRPTSGYARVNGFDVATHPYEVRHSIGFVSSNTAIYDRMTAWEMVEYFGKLYGIDSTRLAERMETVFEQLQMNDIRHIAGARMSTGMKQKVSIARAIVHDPPVLVFDEASLGLDVLVARALLEIIAALREQGKCIIFSTHIMREVERLCDRVGILYRGRMLASGTLPQLAEQYQDDDFEEMFFNMLQRSDEQRAQQAPGSAAGGQPLKTIH